jgi:hypothetical protein
MRLNKRLTGLVAGMAVLAWTSTSSAGPQPSTGTFAADYSGDGKDDIALEGPADVEVRHLDGTVVVGTGSVPNAGGSFVLFAAGYLNNDDNADLVFSGNGQVRVSILNATGTAQSSALFFGNGGGTWGVEAACDVNGDGVDEVIAVGSGAALGAARITDVSTGSASHTFVSTAGGLWGWGFCADVNGDGDEDLVFVGSGAALGTARANLSGGATATFYALGGGVWTPVGAGKTTGSGSDSLIDAGSGAAAGFLRVRTLDSNGAVVASGFIPNGGGTQTFVFAGDFNNDDREDLALRAGGTHKLVLMAADGITSSGQTFPGAAGGDAVLNQGANTNADGAVDLISVLTSNGNVFVQTINEANANASGANTLNVGGRDLL